MSECDAGRPNGTRPPAETGDGVDVSSLLESRSRWLAAAVRMIGDRHAASDVLQNAYATALTRAGTVRDPAHLESWFRRVLSNAAVDFARRDRAYRRTLGRFADEGVDAPSVDATDLDCSCVGRVLADMRPAYAEILRTVDVDGVPLAEAARRAGISATNARVRLHRAREALRSRILLACGGVPVDRCAPCGCSDEGACRPRAKPQEQALRRRR